MCVKKVMIIATHVAVRRAEGDISFANAYDMYSKGELINMKVSNPAHANPM